MYSNFHVDDLKTVVTKLDKNAIACINNHKSFLVLHRKPCICDNVWCVKCKPIFAKQKNSSNAKGFLWTNLVSYTI